MNAPDVDVLVEMSINRQETSSERAKWTVSVANNSKNSDGGIGHNLHVWLEELYKRGLTRKFANTLNIFLVEFKTEAAILLCPDTFRGVARYNTSKKHDVSEEASAAFLLLDFIEDGNVKKLRRCQYRKCNDFFLGRRDAKYCCSSHNTMEYEIEKGLRK